ncbi:MAG: hypothetical protein KJ717_13630 [Proteobacteria bacterium]|nr:hypothetical protein [Pseudomonadota bacterium]
MKISHQHLHGSATTIESLLKAEQFPQARIYFEQNTTKFLDETVTNLKILRSLAREEVDAKNKAFAVFVSQTEPALADVQDLLGKIRKESRQHIMTDEKMLTSASLTRNLTISLGLIATLLGSTLAICSVRNISNTLSKVAYNMEVNAQQVSASSRQIAATSDSLSAGASQQAAAIEEISSTIDQTNAMTLHNAENSSQASSLTKEADEVLNAADQSMKKLTASMDEISQASRETQKIVKTIDEVAFQTNLLALNAAVEAARAGEAGAGFAVVADEVRNLAMRAAEAAKSTSLLIDGTVEKVNKGAKIVTETSDSFYLATQISHKVNDLIHEIAKATQEQSLGLTQINQSVAEIDSVTQQNASSAEESASASRLMSEQAEEMNIAVDELVIMVVGEKDNKPSPTNLIPLRKLALSRV